VLREGFIFASPKENVSRGERVTSVTGDHGRLSSDATFPSNSVAAAGGNTGNGVFTIDGTNPVRANWQAGVYKVICIQAATNSGLFEVLDPAGRSLGSVKVGNTFDNQIKFSIADGSSDFVVGDEFDVTLSGRVVVPNAFWETTTTANGIGVVKINN